MTDQSRKDFYALMSIFAAISLVFNIAFVWDKSTVLNNKQRYELFDGIIYEIDWKVTNVNCINHYNTKCSNDEINYEYNIYANNINTFCTITFLSETNITDTIMSTYVIGKNVIWSKRKDAKDHVCTTHNYRQHYQNQIKVLNKEIMITLWIFITSISIIIIVAGIDKFFPYNENQTINYNPLDNDIEMNIKTNNNKCGLCSKSLTPPSALAPPAALTHKIITLPCRHIRICQKCYCNNKTIKCPSCNKEFK